MWRAQPETEICELKLILFLLELMSASNHQA
jgi:hypothetical protein